MPAVRWARRAVSTRLTSSRTHGGAITLRGPVPVAVKPPRQVISRECGSVTSVRTSSSSRRGARRKRLTDTFSSCRGTACRTFWTEGPAAWHMTRGRFLRLQQVRIAASSVVDTAIGRRSCKAPIAKLLGWSSRRQSSSAPSKGPPRRYPTCRLARASSYRANGSPERCPGFCVLDRRAV